MIIFHNIVLMFDYYINSIINSQTIIHNLIKFILKIAAYLNQDLFNENAELINFEK